MEHDSVDHGAPAHPRRRGQLALLLATIIAATAVAAVVQLLTRSDSPGAVAPFVSQALGPEDSSATLDRHFDALTRVSIAAGGIHLRRAAQSVGIIATGTGEAAWTRHAAGADRSTSFGRESIVVSAPRAEEYLTVARHLGPKVWSWRLEVSRI